MIASTDRAESRESVSMRTYRRVIYTESLEIEAGDTSCISTIATFKSRIGGEKIRSWS